MAPKPCIKGSAIVALVEDLKKLFASGEITPEQAKRWLKREDFALLEERLSLASWYDIRSFTRLSEMIRDTVGGGDNAYLRERGRRAAQRLLEAGLYQQFDYMSRTEVKKHKDPAQRFEAFGRDLRIISTIAPSMVNFSKWKHRVDPEHEGRYLLEVREAEAYPEVLCWTSEGFMNGMSPTVEDAKLWTWERPSRDRVVFRMTRRI